MFTTSVRLRPALRALTFGTVFIAAFSAASWADTPTTEVPCTKGQTILECLEKLQNELLNPQSEGSQMAELKRKTTVEASEVTGTKLLDADLSTFGSSQGAGSLRPFLETFLAGINGVTSSGENGEFMFTYNAPNQRLSIDTIFHQGTVSAALLEAYPEADRDQVAKDLDAKLDDLSDIETKLVFNFTSARGRYGRRVGDYSVELSTLVSEVVDKIDAEKKRRRREAFGTMNDLLGEEVTRGTSVGEATWDEVQDSGKPSLIQRVHDLLWDDSLRGFVADAHLEFVKVVNKSDVGKFYELVANQPQAYIEAGGRFRQKEAGASTWSSKFVWEIPGGSNVNRLRRYCADHGYPEELGLSCYGEYLGLAGTKSSLRSKDRFKLEVVATGIAGYRFTDPENDVMIESGSDIKVTLTGGYSRVLRYVDLNADPATGQEAKAVEASRFDAEIAGEYVDNEATFQRRLKATATVTNRLTDTFDAALSFVWASDPEFRGEVDKEFSVRAGLRLAVGKTGG